jgi:hypothetical protein
MHVASGRTSVRRATLSFVVVAALVGCAPPTEVIDLSRAPQATLDAMVHVPVLPLGIPAPPGVGSVGPISAFGCGQSATAASSDAVQQLQVKALRMQATAVVDVLIGPGGIIGPCQMSYNATASGIAVAARGVPPTW